MVKEGYVCVRKNCSIFYVLYIILKERITRVPKDQRSEFVESAIAPYEEWN